MTPATFKILYQWVCLNMCAWLQFAFGATVVVLCPGLNENLKNLSADLDESSTMMYCKIPQYFMKKSLYTFSFTILKGQMDQNNLCAKEITT